MKCMLAIGGALLMASAALSSQEARSIDGQNRSGIPDVRQIIDSSIAATQRHWLRVMLSSRAAVRPA